MRRLTLISLWLGLGLTSAAHAEQARTATAASQALSGRYHYVGDAGEQAARAEAIDRGIESLFFAIRPIARSRARDATAIAKTCAISVEGSLIRVRTFDRPDYVAPGDGTKARYVYAGDESTLIHRFQGSTLVEHFDQEGEGRINEYSLSEDGQTLKVKVTLYSPQLTRPIVYGLTYRRER